jgi:hypothetical protein
MLLTEGLSGTGARARARATRAKGESESFSKLLDRDRLRLLLRAIKDLDEVSTGNQRSTGSIPSE